MPHRLHRVLVESGHLQAFLDSYSVLAGVPLTFWPWDVETPIASRVVPLPCAAFRRLKSGRSGGAALQASDGAFHACPANCPFGEQSTSLEATDGLKCPYGLRQTILPVAQAGVPIGRFAFGPFYPADDADNPDLLASRATELGISPSQFRETVKSAPVLSPDFEKRMIEQGQAVVGRILQICESEARLRQENSLARKSRKSLARHSALIRMQKKAKGIPREELFDLALEELLAFSESPYGFFGIYDEEKEVLTPMAWSKEVNSRCGIRQRHAEFRLAEGGIWGEAIRRRSFVIVNDYSLPHPQKHGLPEGHVPLSRMMVLPLIDAGKIVALIMVGNKKTPYIRMDVDHALEFLEGIWEIHRHREIEGQLRLSEERRQMAVCGGNLGTWELDLVTGEGGCNDRWTTMLGYLPGEVKPKLHSWGNLVHPEDRRRVIDAHEAHLEGRSGFIEVDCRMLTRSEEWMWVRVHAKVVERSHSGKPLRMIGANININENRRLLERIREAREQAERAVQGKAEFLSMMSHEIRTPLNGILGVITLLLDAGLPNPYAGWLKTVKGSSDALLTLIGDLLHLSRIETGLPCLEETTVDLRASLREAVELMGSRALAKGLPIDLEIDPALPPTIRCDARILRQVLLNLLANAVSFTEHGRIAVRVESGETVAGRRQVKCSISDTGVGIPADRQKLLFRPFPQIETAAAKQTTEAGLGLFISRRLVDHLGGAICVQSEIGKGSTFHFSLPLEGKAGQSSAPAPASGQKVFADGTVVVRSKPAPVGASGRRSGNVLLVEDNRFNREVETALLEMMGCQVDAVTTGAEALQALRSKDYQLVLLDLQIPELDGFEVVKILRGGCARARNPLVPIVALTAHVDEETRQRCLESGMNGFLEKPFRREELEAVVDRWLAEDRGAAG